MITNYNKVYAALTETILRASPSPTAEQKRRAQDEARTIIDLGLELLMNARRKDRQDFIGLQNAERFCCAFILNAQQGPHLELIDIVSTFMRRAAKTYIQTIDIDPDAAKIYARSLTKIGNILSDMPVPQIAAGSSNAHGTITHASGGARSRGGSQPTNHGNAGTPP